jgi:polyhydroxyalkanoate synthesis regulator phasin
MDRLSEVIVRRDEHRQLDKRVASLEREVGDLKQRAAV